LIDLATKLSFDFARLRYFLIFCAYLLNGSKRRLRSRKADESGEENDEEETGEEEEGFLPIFKKSVIIGGRPSRSTEI